ncbi:glycerophosphodiester phosphodiesterase [Microbacterium aquimaris]|uniref:Glycerophosphodiester phosphodiesterase family protein n=1 Tax=Microbacterium aquimaris TaxID=459816 RepID=A0ABU5N577_9MICO|nr:glycerophosphodiester phosphodiesterase family protein [Microbacterium aquimaris]MDZ8161231.1 glycerophosphodiester phosphodiesterase family protein [Microbacterium aquimaris]
MTAIDRSEAESLATARFAVAAHRGASIERPENTLAAFAAAIAHGADGIELDVALSADGVPVVVHDDTVDRTTDGHGPVDGFTVAQLAALDAGAGEGVPTLAEVLALAEGRVEVNIEIKAPVAVPAVVEVVTGFPDLAWIVSSFHWPALVEMRERAPQSRLYPLTLGVGDPEVMRRHAVEAGHPADRVEAWFTVLVEQLGKAGFEPALAFAERIGAEGLSIWEDSLGAPEIDRIHAAGLRAYVWTVNDVARARDLADAGADAICTDDPAGVLSVRG